MISYNNSAPNAVNNVGQFGATEGSIGAYKSAAEYAADAKYWALLSQTKYNSVEDILAEVERLYAQGLLLEEDIKQLKIDFEAQQQDLLGLIQSTNTAIDNTNAATELSKEATQEVLAQLDIISNMTVQTTLLPPGSMATGSYDNSTGVFSFGIPEGQPGRDGTDGTISDIGNVPVGTPATDDYGFYVDKIDGGLYRADMSDIANLVPSVRSVSINGGAEQMGAVAFNSVSSFNSRTGDVVSQNGDYEVSQITGAASSGANSDITSLSGLTTALSVSQGGTGATTAEESRTNLGLGSVSVEDVVPLTKGGTGATTADAARTSLGLGLVSTESIVPITKGGTGSTSAENARLALVAAKSGDNSDITSMTNSVTFTQPVSVADAVDATNAVNLGQISSDQGASLIGTLEGVPVQNIISNINTDIIQLKLNWAIENGYSDAGFTFTTGGTLTVDDRDKVVYDPVSQTWYSYAGSLPVTVPAGFNPVGNANWKPQTDPTVRDWAQFRFKPLPYLRAEGSFLEGGTATSKISALRHTDGFYYMPLSGTITAPPGSSPDSSWICVGLLSNYELGDIRNFGGVGDGVAVDTEAVRKAITLANYTKDKVYIPAGYTFLCDKLQFTGLSDITIAGKGAIKMIGGRSGAFYYADGAQLTFINSYKIRIIGVEFDGNRAGSPSYTGFNHGIQFVTGAGDFRSNNGGATKANQNIYISKCYFHDQGGYNAGIDKFGDGIYLFGCDGVVIEGNFFKDIGRWGVAGSDCFNVRVVGNHHDCSKPGTVALGFCDIENESTDSTNGSYSRNITIANNTIVGFGQILVGAGNNTENSTGDKHYLKNVVVTGNSLIIEENTHETPSYLTNLVFIGVAPFCHVAPASAAMIVENSGIVVSNNTLTCSIPGNIAIGVGVNAQGIGNSNGFSNSVNNITFSGNTIFGFSKGVQVGSDIVSTGYSFKNLIIDGNAIDCNGVANSIGIRTVATRLVGVMVQNNTVRSAATRGISIEDGVNIGAIDSYVMVSDNEVNSATGTNVFAVVYRVSFHGNGSRGGALVLDATVTNIDKDYGNSWNHILRTINGFTVNSMSQVTQDAIDIGSQIRFGYNVKLVPPFNLEGAQSSAMVTGPGLARAFITNMSGSPVSKASDVWHITVEKK